MDLVGGTVKDILVELEEACHRSLTYMQMFRKALRKLLEGAEVKVHFEGDPWASKPCKYKPLSANRQSVVRCRKKGFCDAESS